MTKQQAATKQAQWMARYEDALIALKPELAGRVDWRTATFLYHQKMLPHHAARRGAGLPDLPQHTCHYPGSNPANCPACK